MEKHPIDSLLKNTMENLRSMVDVDNILGNPVQCPDGSVIIPISKLSLGFAAGGSEFNSSCKAATNECKFPFGGGSGAGVSMKPVAFLVVQKDSIRLLHVDSENTYDKIIDTIPQLLDIFKDMCHKSKCSCDENDTCSCESGYYPEENL